MRRNIKRIILTILSFFIILIAISPQHYVANADKSKDKITNGLKEYNDGETPEVMAQLRAEGEPKNKDTIQYVLFRVLKPGYINNVEKGNYASEDFIDKTVRDDDTGSVCLPNEPKNLANHNCDVPNVMGEFSQAFFNIIGVQGIQNGERTSAFSNFGFGVPTGIPGDKVPTKTKGAPIEYSGLEKYGYDLEFTTYAGEWDRISVSTQARLLSNFGLYDSILLTGTSIFNGLKGGITNLVNNFTWNPFMWIPTFIDGFTGGAFNTIIDTSDLNVIASHAWTRPSFPVYNVAYISNKEVTLNAQLLYMNQFPGMLKDEAEKDPEVKKLIELQNLPKFEYDPAKETEASKKAREEAISHNNSVGEEDKKEVPAPVYMTKEEQFKEYKKSDFFKPAKGELRKCANKDSYEEMEQCWPQAWQSMGEQVLEGRGPLVKKLTEKAKNKFFKENPIANPNVTISHYVCADENNKPLGSVGSYKFYFKGFNTPDSENLTNECTSGTARQPIKGGYFGTGDNQMTDTRRLAFTAGNVFSDFLNPLSEVPNNIASFFQGIAVFSTKLTNMLVGFAFGDLIEKLGLLTLLETVIQTLMDSLFFPFAVLGSAVTGVYYLFTLIRHKSLREAFKGILIFVLIIFMGAFVTTNTKLVIKSVEAIPNTIDKIVFDAVNNANNEDNDICNVSGDNSGIRNIQCTIWEFNVFQPWVQGQFGTTYDNLNSANMKNTNSNIVGDASVDMGGGKIVRNWATYQLEKTKSGSITTLDTEATNGTTDANLYRLVDLQAGPNNGQGTDSRFFETWSSGEYNRLMSMFYSTFTSIASLIVLGGLAIFKIEIKVLLIMYIFVLPFALLVGLFANKYLKTVEYVNTIFILILKQLMLTLLFAVLMITLGGLTKVASNVSFGVISMLMVAILMFGFMYRKEFVNLVAVGSNAPDTSIVKEQLSKVVPRNIKYKYSEITGNIKGSVGGAIGGALRNDREGETVIERALSGAVEGAANEIRRNERTTFNQHRKYGFNVLTKMENAKTAVFEQMQSKTLSNPLSRAIIRDIKEEARISPNADFHYIANLTDREILTEEIMQFIDIKRQAVSNGVITDKEMLVNENVETLLLNIAQANPKRKVLLHKKAQEADKESLQKYKHLYTYKEDTYYDDSFSNVDVDSKEQSAFVERRRAIEKEVERRKENERNNVIEERKDNILNELDDNDDFFDDNFGGNNNNVKEELNNIEDNKEDDRVEEEPKVENNKKDKVVEDLEDYHKEKKTTRKKTIIEELFDTEEKHEEVIVNAVKETVENVKKKISNVLEGEKTTKAKNILIDMFETKDEVDLSKTKKSKHQQRKESRKQSLKDELDKDDFWDNMN